MKIITLLITVGLCIGTASAQLPRIIVQGSDGPQVFTSINEAITSAQPNDKLYLSGGTFLEPNGIAIDKTLHFVGAGIHPDTSNTTGTTTLSTGGSTTITITTNASQSTFTGIVFNPGSIIQYGTDISNDDPVGLIFQRCSFNKSVYLGFAEGASSSSSFDECIFRGTLSGRASTAVITHCIFDDATISLFRPSGLFLKNSVILDSRLQNSGNAIVQNCVFTYSGAPLWQVHGVQISNCLITGDGMFSNSSENFETNNIYGQNASDIFVNETDGTYDFDDDLHLDPGSPGVGAANDGTDIGIYGSGLPFKEGAAPFNPHYQAATIEASSNGNGELPVNIRMAAQQD